MPDSRATRALPLAHTPAPILIVLVLAACGPGTSAPLRVEQEAGSLTFHADGLKGECYHRLQVREQDSGRVVWGLRTVVPPGRSGMRTFDSAYYLCADDFPIRYGEKLARTAVLVEPQPLRHGTAYQVETDRGAPAAEFVFEGN